MDVASLAVGMPAGRALGAALFLLLTLLGSRSARACGPCATPEFWGVEEHKGTPIAVTAFGLLSHAEGGLHLTCEEVIGGLMLGTASDGERLWVSTDHGLFVREAAACGFAFAQAGSQSEWFLDFVLAGAEPSRRAAGESQDAGLGEATRFGLAVDNVLGRRWIERATSSGDFQPSFELEFEHGHRRLVAGGDPAAVYASGYSYEPTTFHLAYALDAGHDWSDFALEATDPGHLFAPLGVDPRYPRTLLLALETRPTEADEVWSFDADSRELTRHGVFEGAQLYRGFAIQGEHLYVAARADGETAGTLYRASRDTRDFAKFASDGPAYDCLSSAAGELFACVNDFDRDSVQLLARSKDDGRSWSPSIAFQDFQDVRACAGCSETENWLVETHDMFVRGGSATDAGSDASVGDAGVFRRDAQAEVLRPEQKVKLAGGCAISLGTTPAPSQAPGAPLALVGIIVAAVLGRRCAVKGVRQHRFERTGLETRRVPYLR